MAFDAELDSFPTWQIFFVPLRVMLAFAPNRGKAMQTRAPETLMPFELPSPSKTFEVSLDDGAKIKIRRHGNPVHRQRLR